jgi:hypothetical protein
MSLVSGMPSCFIFGRSRIRLWARRTVLWGSSMFYRVPAGNSSKLIIYTHLTWATEKTEIQKLRRIIHRGNSLHEMGFIKLETLVSSKTAVVLEVTHSHKQFIRICLTRNWAERFPVHLVSLGKLSSPWYTVCGLVDTDWRYRGAYCFHQAVHPDKGGLKLLWKVGQDLPDHTVQHPGSQPFLQNSWLQKMITAVFAEMSVNTKHSTRLSPANRSFHLQSPVSTHGVGRWKLMCRVSKGGWILAGTSRVSLRIHRIRWAMHS